MATEPQNTGIEADIGITLNKLVRQLSRAEAQINKSANQAEKRWKTANEGIATSFRKPEKAAQRATRAFDGFGRQASRSSRQAGHFALGLRNVGLQLNQVAQQGAITGDYMRALSFQLPDLLLGFGTIGIFAGVAAGALQPLIMSLLSTEEASKEAEDALKGLETAMQALSSARSAANQPLVDLDMDFGPGFAQQAKAILEVQRAIAEVNAQLELTRTTSALAGSVLSNVGGRTADELELAAKMITRLRDEIESLQLRDDTTAADVRETALALAEARAELSSLDSLTDLFAEIAGDLEISEAAAADLAVAFARLNDATEGRDQAAAIRSLREQIIAAAGDTENLSEEWLTILSRLSQAEIAALQLSRIDIASGIGDAADEAERLADNLTRAKGGKVYSGRGTSPGAGSTPIEQTLLRMGGEVAAPSSSKPASTATTSRTSGSARAVDNSEREAQRVYDQTRTILERYNLEVEKLNRLRQEQPDIVTEEVYGRALDDAADAMERAIQQTRVLENTFASAFANMITSGESLSDTLRNLLNQLANMALTAGFQGLFGSVFGGIAPAFGVAGARASGGPVRAGMPYLVNENTPNSEVFVPSTSGAVLNVQQAQRALSMGGGGGVVVNNTIPVDARGAQIGVAEQIQAAIQQAAPVITQASVAAVRSANIRGKR